jgi:hypothetical protein
MTKRKSREPAVPKPIVGPVSHAAADPRSFVSATKLRAMLGISPVTLWRWRQDKRLKFPEAREINGRLYFQWDAVCAWYARRPRADLKVAA